MARKKTAIPNNFEAALTELETLVEQMESGDLSLEQSLQEFERGMALSKQCQTLLSQAEQRVALLSQEETLEPFDEQEQDQQ